MKDNLSIVISMIIFVILIVIFPLYNYFERQDDMSYNLALKTTTNFVDEVTESGYLDQDTYNRFVEELSDTGNVYDIQLEAHKKVKTTQDSGETYNEEYLIDYNDQIFDSTSGNVSADLNERTIRGNSYVLEEGDQFYVKLKNSNTTMAGAIFNTIVPSSKKDRIVVNYGGIVKNEAWAKVDATYMDLKDTTAPKVYWRDGGEVSSSIEVPSMSGRLTFKVDCSGIADSWHSVIKKAVWELEGASSSGEVTLDGDKKGDLTVDLNSSSSSSTRTEVTLSVRAKDAAEGLTEPKRIKIKALDTDIVGTDGSHYYPSTSGTHYDSGELSTSTYATPPSMSVKDYTAFKKRPAKLTFQIYLGDISSLHRSDIGIKLYSKGVEGGEIEIKTMKKKTEGHIKINAEIYAIYHHMDGEDLKVDGVTYKNAKYNYLQGAVKFTYTEGITEEEIRKFCDGLKVEYKAYGDMFSPFKYEDTDGTEKAKYLFKYRIWYEDY